MMKFWFFRSVHFCHHCTSRHHTQSLMEWVSDRWKVESHHDKPSWICIFQEQQVVCFATTSHISGSLTSLFTEIFLKSVCWFEWTEFFSLRLLLSLISLYFGFFYICCHSKREQRRSRVSFYLPFKVFEKSLCVEFGWILVVIGRRGYRLQKRKRQKKLTEKNWIIEWTYRFSLSSATCWLGRIIAHERRIRSFCELFFLIKWNWEWLQKLTYYNQIESIFNLLKNCRF